MYPKFIFVIYLAKSVFVFKIVYANLLPKLSALSSDQIDKNDVDFGAVRIRKNVQWFTRWRQIRRLIVVDNTQSSSKFPFTSLYICYGWIHRLIPQNTRQWPELEKKAVFGRPKNLRIRIVSWSHSKDQNQFKNFFIISVDFHGSLLPFMNIFKL